MSSTSITRYSRFLAAALAAAFVLSSGCAKRGPREHEGARVRGGDVGTAAPAFTLPDLEGKQVSNTDLLGKVVLLDFWATWCPPCKAEIPHFIEMQKKYKDQGLEIVGLSLDDGGVNDVKPFAKEYGINYTMLIASQETAKDYGGITGIPTTFVVDRKGVIVKRFLGYTDPAVFEATIQPLLVAN